VQIKAQQISPDDKDYILLTPNDAYISNEFADPVRIVKCGFYSQLSWQIRITPPQRALESVQEEPQLQN